MSVPTALVIPIEKAVYLFTRASESCQGGDKQKFWREVMGFESPELIRETLLSSINLSDLQFQRQDQYGERYQASSLIQGASGIKWWVKTGWIVRSGETVAHFVTAIPEKSRGG